MTRVSLLVVLALFLCVGCGGDDEGSAPAPQPPQATTTEPATTEETEPDQAPGDFMKEVVNQGDLGQHGRVWATLHPLHQAVASRAKFVECESRETVQAQVEKLEVVETYDEPIRIPGQTADVPSKAITIRLTYTVPGFDKPQTATSTVHAVADDGQWRWLLRPEEYKAYKAGRCPPL